MSLTMVLCKAQHFLWKARCVHQKNLSETLGRLLENQVFVELMRRGCIPGQTLFYYRTRNDKEIDFVTRKDAKVEQLIQVCYDMTSGKTRKRELDALVEAADELNCDNLLVVTNAQQEKIEWKSRTINVIERCFYSTERWFCYRQV